MPNLMPQQGKIKNKSRMIHAIPLIENFRGLKRAYIKPFPVVER